MRMCSDKGYSLLEVLIGLMIFTIGALASGLMIVASMKQNTVAKERTKIASLVSQRMEELRSRLWEGSAYDSLQAGGAILSEDDLRSYSPGMLDSSYSETFDYDLNSPADTGMGGPFYIVMWRTEDMTDSGLDLKRITIRGAAMSWRIDMERWEPIASFDHVSVIFREIKAQ